jgi:hypothetical protein
MNFMQVTFKKLKDFVRRHSVASGVLYFANMLLAALDSPLAIVAYALFVQPVPLRPMLQKNAKTNITVRLISRDEYRVEWFDRPASVIERRFQQNTFCFVAFDQDKPVGSLWLCCNNYMEDEVRCRFILQPADAVAWDFDVYVAPKYRMSRVFVYLWDAGDAWLREHGFRWSCSRIDMLNMESMRAHQRMGASRIGVAVFVKGWDWQLTLATLRPFAHFSRNDRSFPQIPVGPGVDLRGG